jgi:type I restriction enzyme S subunit
MDNVLMEKKVLNIDKSTWKLTKLGELLEDISRRVDNPSQSGYDRFVGLEHFVSGDIKIKNWGTTENLTSSTKAFKAGDILFARRNAYLRRASLVDFDGCCSGDAFVLRENHNKVVPGFMAFFMNSNAVWDFANENAAGTMSQRVKWRDLATYEFLLPPKDQQAQLAELLWVMDEVIEKKELLTESLQQFYNFKREELLNKTINGKQVKLGDISRLQGGATFKSTDSTDEGVKWLKIANVGFHEVKWDDESYLPIHFLQEYPEFVLNEGDIVIALTRPILGDRLKIARINGDDSGALLNQRVGRIKLNDNSILQSYLYEHMKSNSFLLAMKRELQGTDPPNISNSMYENYQITLPDLITQQKIQNILSEVQSSYLSSKAHATISKVLQKSLINQIF